MTKTELITQVAEKSGLTKNGILNRSEIIDVIREMRGEEQYRGVKFCEGVV